MEGNYQIASITALILLVPSILFMVIIHKFMRPEMLSKLGNNHVKEKRNNLNAAQCWHNTDHPFELDWGSLSSRNENQ